MNKNVSQKKSSGKVSSSVKSIKTRQEFEYLQAIAEHELGFSNPCPHHNKYFLCQECEIRIREQDIIDRIEYCMNQCLFGTSYEIEQLNQCLFGTSYEIEQHLGWYDIETESIITSTQLRALVNEFSGTFIHSMPIMKNTIDVGSIGDN